MGHTLEGPAQMAALPLPSADSDLLLAVSSDGGLAIMGITGAGFCAVSPLRGIVLLPGLHHPHRLVLDWRSSGLGLALGGWRTTVYERRCLPSLGSAMLGRFLAQPRQERSALNAMARRSRRHRGRAPDEGPRGRSPRTPAKREQLPMAPRPPRGPPPERSRSRDSSSSPSPPTSRGAPWLVTLRIGPSIGGASVEHAAPLPRPLASALVPFLEAAHHAPGPFGGSARLESFLSLPLLALHSGCPLPRAGDSVAAALWALGPHGRCLRCLAGTGRGGGFLGMLPQTVRAAGLR